MDQMARIAIIVFVCTLAFTYGMAVGKYGWFPYDLIISAKRMVLSLGKAGDYDRHGR